MLPGVPSKPCLISLLQCTPSTGHTFTNYFTLSVTSHSPFSLSLVTLLSLSGWHSPLSLTGWDSRLSLIVHSLTHSHSELTHSLTHLGAHSLTHSLGGAHSLRSSLSHQSSLTHSLTHLGAHSLIRAHSLT